MSEERISNYREFWKFYVGEHSKASTRGLHFVGTGLVIGLLIAGVLVSPRLFWCMPIAGYFFAWVAHFGFEKNRPATFKYPVWSLMADFHMFAFILTGKMGAEVRKYGKPYSKAS